jgi:RNA polymerase sigma-70 factor (sigma-E family)
MRSKRPGGSANGGRVAAWPRGWRLRCGYRCLVSVGGDHVVAGIRDDCAGLPRSHAVTRAEHGGRTGRGEAAARWAAAAAAVPPPGRGGPDDPGFRDYVAARGGSLLRMAYVLTRNQADAEDLVQAALAKTYQAWDRIEDVKSLDGYVRRAMVNTHISWWRRRRVEEYPTDDIPDQAVADHADDSELADALRRALGRLPSRMRTAVVLRYYEDMSEAEIAAVLGISQGTVKSTVSRAVAKLRIDAELLKG